MNPKIIDTLGAMEKIYQSKYGIDDNEKVNCPFYDLTVVDFLHMANIKGKYYLTNCIPALRYYE